MKRLLSLATILIASISLINGCSMMSPKYEAGKQYHLTILHTNDHHGRFWKNDKGEYGMAARKTLIDSIRSEVESEGGSVLLLSGGDINTGVPESDLQDAKPDFIGMKALGYDAMAVGNHEFDNSREVLEKQESWAGFPFLSANIFYKGTDKTLFKPYKIFNVQGNKIAVMGLTTEDTVKIGNPEYTGDLDFRSPVSVASKLVPELRKKADIVVAATHMGHYANGNYGGNAPGDVTLARKVSGIDVIVGGHSQNPLFEPDVQNNTLILQAYEWGKYVGRLDLVIQDGKIQNYQYRLIPVNLKKKEKDADGKSIYTLMEKEIAEDPAMLALLTPYQEKGSESLNVIIGSSNGLFVGDRSVVRKQETNLGNLIAKAQKEKTKADVGVMNSGGIRADMEGGDITYKDVLTVQPFANMLSYVDFTGKELFDYLTVAANKEAGSGAFAQFDGVSMDVKNGKIMNVKIAGKPLDMNATYRLAVNAYVASGGDGYPKITDHPNYVNTGFVDADMLVEYIKNHSPLKVEDFAPSNAVNRM
ncbi:bifunctional UDP-sugar hydrolase/5'-nucleotidase UshA [Gynuella sp.]|uniref:bifunctional UDP-sugar hydrolase/5'-nucleotidase UshA n=1 Tax=Gynuella sp. TaxID=2969146 RepID=UPI003D09C311